MPIDTWPIEEYVRVYGMERITWLLLNLPLPEELERYRSEKLAAVIPKKSSGPQAVLWERIKQLGDELTRQRRRAENLAKQLFEERAEKARLSEELHVLRKEIEQLKNNSQSATRNIDDVLRIKRLKTLISELREENTKLRRQLEELGIKEVQDIEGEHEERNDEAVEAVGKTQDIEEDVLGRIRNKNVAVYGRVGENYDKGPVIAFREGDK